MTIKEAQALQPGDRIHYGLANATVESVVNNNVTIVWDHGARQTGNVQKFWMFERSEH